MELNVKNFEEPNKYAFKSDAYDEVLRAMRDNSVVFLTGPHKCGKTVCLTQIAEALHNSVTVNFRHIQTDNDKLLALDEVYNAIKTNRECVFLLDDFEYAFCPELAIEKISNLFYDSDTINTKTKIVFAGNPMNAIATWANRAFGKNAAKVRMKFLTYEEYLRFSGRQKSEEDMYTQFCLHTGEEFYHIGSLEEYLGECLKSSIVSNQNTSNIIFLNETYLIEDNVAVLMDVCRLSGSFNAVGKQTVIEKGTTESSDLRAYSQETVKQAIQFLERHGILEIKFKGSNTSAVRDFYKNADRDISVDELLNRYDICFSHPIFLGLLL